MNAAAALKHLEVALREELDGKRRALELLARQEAAIAANEPAALEEALKGVEREVQLEARRAARRRQLVAALAEAWRVPADALTLGSIVERAGRDAGRLATLRVELRDAVASVKRRNRRLAALVGMQRRLTRDVMKCVLEDEDGAALHSAGTLVNAEA